MPSPITERTRDTTFLMRVLAIIACMHKFAYAAASEWSASSLQSNCIQRDKKASASESPANDRLTSFSQSQRTV
jgi:hypothetical protein